MTNIPSHIINQKINYFNGVLDSSCNTLVSIKKILEAIKDGKWKEEIEWYRHDEEDQNERKEIKKRFPGCTFSGTFKRRRFDANIDSYTGILVIDIDKLTMSLSKTIECLKSTPFVFAVFKSTGGEGVKALAFSEMESKSHKNYFKGIEEYMMDEFGIIIDPSGKNVGRLCFISYDPELYLSFKDKEVFTLEKFAPKTIIKIEEERFQEVQIANTDYEDSHDLRFITEIAVKWTENGVGSYHKGNRNNFIFTLSCILNRSGVQEYQTQQIIFNRFKSLGHSEVTQTVSSAYKHNKHEFGTYPIQQKNNKKQKRIL